MPPTSPTQMRIPLDLLARVDAAAEEAGVTRTRWALDAFEAQLSRQSEPPPVELRPDPEMMDELVAGSKPRARTPKPDTCPHPVGRRIGPNCAVCGAKVGK